MAGAVVMLVLAGCGGQSSNATTTSAATTEDRPGDPGVYQRIDRMTSCSALQREFDIAMDNTDIQQDMGNAAMASVTISYGHAAEERMHVIGCYG